MILARVTTFIDISTAATDTNLKVSIASEHIG